MPLRLVKSFKFLRKTRCFVVVESGLHEDEDVYSALGQTHGGRYLIVFFVFKIDGRALVISAREMTASEKKRYAQR